HGQLHQLRHPERQPDQRLRSVPEQRHVPGRRRPGRRLLAERPGDVRQLTATTIPPRESESIMRTRTLALATLAAGGLVLGAAGQAGAATVDVLTVGAVGGTNVNVGDSLTGAINSDFVFTTSS